MFRQGLVFYFVVTSVTFKRESRVDCSAATQELSCGSQNLPSPQLKLSRLLFNSFCYFLGSCLLQLQGAGAYARPHVVDKKRTIVCSIALLPWHFGRMKLHKKLGLSFWSNRQIAFFI